MRVLSHTHHLESAHHYFAEQSDVPLFSLFELDKGKFERVDWVKSKRASAHRQLRAFVSLVWTHMKLHLNCRALLGIAFAFCPLKLLQKIFVEVRLAHLINYRDLSPPISKQ
jgi:hypothetical protein